MEKSDTEKQLPLESENDNNPSPQQSSNNPLYCSYVDGKFTYKDPTTSTQYVWNETEKKWVVKEGQQLDNNPEQIDSNKLAEMRQEGGGGEVGGNLNSGGSVGGMISPAGTSQVQFDGENYTYTDQDGTVFLWDAAKGAWFPKLSEDFMVSYQLAYGGGISSSVSKEDEEKSAKQTAASSRKQEKQNNKSQQQQQQQQPQWFDLDDTRNTHVYVSNLPLDIDENEFVEFMGKCGLVMKDPSGNWKVKLYRDGEGNLKGDGVCTYIKVDSVNLALQILDSSYFKSNIVKVERAKFQQKGDYDATRKPKQKKKRDKLKLKKQQESLFSWKPEKLRGEKGKNERIVIVKNAFHPDEFNDAVELILELKEDFKLEADKFGACKNVVLYDNNTEGALKITMTTPDEATAVMNSFNGRYFGGKRLEAYIWDGFEKLNVVETEAERKKRLERWEKYVDEDEEDDKSGATVAAAKRPKLEDDEDATPPHQGEVDSDDEKIFDDD